jgi:hypothetical protein
MSVYFAQRRRGGLIKIGWSRSVQYRLRVLKAKLLGNIPGGRSAEKAVHKEFAHLRARGEWYRPADELMEYIRTQAQNDVPDAEIRQTAIRLPEALLKRVDKLVAYKSKDSFPITRSKMLRAAMIRGLDALETEWKKR